MPFISCTAAPDLVPLERWVLLEYLTDWDGWHVHSSYADEQEARQWYARLEAQQDLWPGVALVEVRRQDTRPRSDVREGGRP